MTTNEFERDLNDTSFLKRPGRIDLIIFQNTADCGDGHPGIQRCFRNYLHEGGMEKDLDMVGYSIKGASVDINNAELQQLSNIGANTISPTQWGYLSVLDQNLRQSDSPTFTGLTLASLTVNGAITVTGNVDGVDISTFKSDYDTHKTSNGSDHTYINQDVKSGASPTFVGLTLSADLVTTSTIDGVDISTIKLNSMPSAADGNINANTQKIINVVDPTADQHVATKKYTDDQSIHGIASDDLVFSNDTERIFTYATFGKMKEIAVYRSTRLRVYWEHHHQGSGYEGQSRVYVNGGGVGSIHNAGITYSSETEDIEINSGDLVQIYAWGRLSSEPYTPSDMYVRYQRIKFIEYVNNMSY